MLWNSDVWLKSLLTLLKYNQETTIWSKHVIGSSIKPRIKSSLISSNIEAGHRKGLLFKKKKQTDKTKTKLNKIKTTTNTCHFLPFGKFQISMLIIPFINLLIKYCLCFQSKKARGTFYNTSQEALQEVTQNLSITPHIQQQLVFWWLCSTGFLLKPTKRKKEKPPVRSGLDLRTKQDWKLMASTCYQESWVQRQHHLQVLF